MIGKISSQPATEYVQIERSINEPGPQIKEDPVTERPLRESSEQTANARRNEMAITGATQKAFLDSQIQMPAKQTPVAAKQPEPIADTSSNLQTLKLGDKTVEVDFLVGQLNHWQFRNHVKETPFTNGAYTQEVETAIKEFQKANNLPETGKADPTTQRRLKLENDRNFQFLDNEVKQSIRSALTLYADQPDAQENLLKLATDKQFAHLISKDSQTSAINALLMHPSDKNHLKNVQDAVVDMAILEREKTLEHLPESTKRQVINTLFKKTEDTPAPGFHFDPSDARKTVIDLAKSPDFARLNESQQRKLMDAVAANPSSSAGYMQGIISSDAFNLMDSKMKERVIDLAYENAIYPNHTAVKKGNEYTDRLYNLSTLLRSKTFQSASEDDKYAQLNSMRTPVSNQKKDLDIL